MKRIYTIAALTALAVILVFGGIHYGLEKTADGDKIVKVGIVYIGDESEAYTKNFIRAQKSIEERWGDRVEIDIRENVAVGTEEQYLRELAEDGCDIIFATSYGYEDTTKELASEYPEIQFCQATGSNANVEPVYDNYHTFMGYIYEGRYVAGVVAGLKLQELIDDGTISLAEAKVGYVAAFPYAEVISGYTAFFMGVRSVVPEAQMYVRYTDSWGDSTLEKRTATKLIEEGCVIISQHSDTMGPAVACEDAAIDHVVYYVGYNQSMISVAPTTALISAGINWEPYMTAAVQAVFEGEAIETVVDADIRGNDAGAGFDKGWIRMTELNSSVAAPGTAEVMEQVIEQLSANEISVFQGEYTGADPSDPADTVDLRTGYMENEDSSAPSFHYVLNNVIQIED
jgi:basic membrane protein A